ncbi:MAG: MFS transporter, partial [Candidatus Thorarchaeota archaeon]
FSIPSIMGLKNRPAAPKPEEEGMSYISIGFSRVRKTFREIRNYQGLPLFMVAYFLFSDAITTVIYYAALFGEEVYLFSRVDILIFFAVTQLAAIPGAFIFGYVADRIKTKPTLMITLMIWVIALVIAYFGSAQIVWWIVGMIAGVGMGSAQSTARSMFGQYIPEEKKSEMYGIYALTGKFAAILGPFVYATVLTLSQGLGFTLIEAHKNSLLSILMFFVVSLLLLIKVRQPIMGASTTSDSIIVEDDLGTGF